MTPFKKRCAVIAFGCAFVAGVVCGRMMGSTPAASPLTETLRGATLQLFERPVYQGEMENSEQKA